MESKRPILIIASMFLFFSPCESRGESSSVNHMLGSLNLSICGDLAAATCRPGKYDDGTGSSTLGEKTAEESTLYAQKKIRSNIQDYFKKIFSGVNNSYFQELGMSAYGLKNNKVCQSPQSQSQNACLDILASNATDKLMALIARE